MAARRMKVKAAVKTVKMAQITTGHFSSPDGSSTYSVLGVGTNGRVYRYDAKCDAWIPWSNKVSTCKKKHKAGR